MIGNGLARGGSFYLPGDHGVVVPGYHMIGVAHGQWYRLITYAFVHSLPTQPPLGITHIIMNMWSLWVLGPTVELVMGRIRFAVLYLLSALGGSVAIMLLAPAAGGYGASGAIFGLAGAYFVICKRLKRDVVYANRLALYSVVWLAATAWFTSWEGHLGGLLAGGCAHAGLRLRAAPDAHARPGRSGRGPAGAHGRARRIQGLLHQRRGADVAMAPPHPDGDLQEETFSRRRLDS
jgi:membrane associated rhomboid family serine protease